MFNSISGVVESWQAAHPSELPALCPGVPDSGARRLGKRTLCIPTDCSTVFSGRRKGSLRRQSLWSAALSGGVDLRCFDDETVLAASPRPGMSWPLEGGAWWPWRVVLGFVAAGVGVTPTGVVRVGVLDRVRYHVFASVNHRKSGGRGE